MCVGTVCDPSTHHIKHSTDLCTGHGNGRHLRLRALNPDVNEFQLGSYIKSPALYIVHLHEIHITTFTSPSQFPDPLFRRWVIVHGRLSFCYHRTAPDRRPSDWVAFDLPRYGVQISTAKRSPEPESRHAYAHDVKITRAQASVSDARTHGACIPDSAVFLHTPPAAACKCQLHATEKESIAKNRANKQRPFLVFAGLYIADLCNSCSAL